MAKKPEICKVRCTVRDGAQVKAMGEMEIEITDQGMRVISKKELMPKAEQEEHVQRMARSGGAVAIPYLLAEGV